jgi:hypothetical protein
MDMEQFCFGLSGGDLQTVWESLTQFVPAQEHAELQRVLGWSAVERNQGLAEELRVLMRLLEGMEADGGGGGGVEGGGGRDAFERTALQQQIAFFVDKMSGKAASAKAPPSPLSLGGPRKTRGSVVGGSSTGSAASRSNGGGGAKELVQTVLASGVGGGGSISRENSLDLPSAPLPPPNSTSSAWLWSAPAHHSSLECLRAALDAEEEALLADIQFLQGRVCDTAGETKEVDAQALKARKAELQKKWLEMEARNGGSGGGGGGEGGPLQPTAPSLPTSSTSSLRLHRVLNSSTSAVAPAPPRPAAAPTRGVGVSRVAQAALAERFTAPPSQLPQKGLMGGGHEAASKAVVDDEARFFS